MIRRKIMKKIFTVLMMLFAGFFATAEIIADGNDSYIIMNDRFCCKYYCGDERFTIDSKAKMDRAVKALVDRWGLPDVYVSDNKELDSEVAKITKKHGFSITWTDDFDYIANVYYKGTFRFYGWRKK